MNKRAVLAVLGIIFTVFSTLILATSVAFMLLDERPNETRALLVAAVLGSVVGITLYFAFRRHVNEDAIGIREGMAMTAIAWILLAGLGGLPYHLAYPHQLGLTDGYFESMSGLTTTGASILADIEKLGRPLLFWRSLTQWLGGMGIILLVIAILPWLGAGGYQLFRAEVPGPTKDRIKPRLVETAKTLWRMYFVITVVAVGLLMLCGLPFFDALCHTFSSVATGGFSTYNLSAGHFATPQSGMSPTGAFFAELILIGFMFLAGINFLHLYTAWTERSFGSLWRSSEFRTYLGICIVATVVIAVLLTYGPNDKAALVGSDQGKGYAAGAALRGALFQVVSILSNTGYATDDFDLWPTAARVILLMLMLVGGCSGSTAGGLKVARLIILAKFTWRELLKAINPREVVVIKFDGRPVAREVVGGLIGFTVIYLGTLAIGTCALALVLDGNAALVVKPPAALASSTADLVATMRSTGHDPFNGTLLTAFTACLSTLTNIGPGLSAVGPTRHYGHLPVAGKWILCLLMLMGRLELFPVLILFSIRTWRK